MNGMKGTILTLLACSVATGLHAQRHRKAVTVTDTIKTAVVAPPASTVQPYEKVITKNAQSKSGMFTVHLVDNKYYFEIPDSLLHRDILVVTRFVGTPEGATLYAGEKANERTVYFEKATGNKVLLRVDIFRAQYRDSSQAIAQAVRSSAVKPILFAFDVKAVNPANGNTVIDVTDFLKKDNAATGPDNDTKTEMKLGGLADDRSFIDKVNAYPINIEVRTTKTWSSSGGAIPAGEAAGAITAQLNTSMVLLPKVPMRRRLFDERVGFFANKYTLYDDEAQWTSDHYFIQRWRLEPKDEDLEKYKRGELVEPKNPLVYYIDPATPKKWRPYLIAGINDWQQAFEQAGFKNAIIAKEWPENDSTMSMEDARFSVVRYLASDIPNAYGPRISDPRSGEIIESHIGWYHNVMKLIHDWYMIQAGPNDARARKMEFDDELMGDLIRFVSSHEIGHTLGLRHNMGASYGTPVELLRNKAWVEANGHTASIMDYARFNYVAQPEDHIGKAGIYPRIGVYDKWAIRWGYREIFDTKDEYADNKILNKWIVDSLKANPRLWFGGEGKSEDPRSQAEDLSDDVMKANDYGIKNLKRVVPNLVAWTKEDGDLDDNLDRMYKGVIKQYTRYLYHVMKYVGGTYVTYKSADQAGAVYEPVPKDKLKEALDFMGRNLMEPPLWLYDSTITTRLRVNPMDDIFTLQNNFLTIILNPGMFYNLTQKYSGQGKNSYPVTEYLADVKRLIWKPLTGNPAQDIYRRNLQRMYVEKLAMGIHGASIREGKLLSNMERSDAHLYARMQLEQIQRELKATVPAGTLNQAHVKDLLQQIDKILKGTDKAVNI